MDKILTINCDGGSRGNPGPAASAFVVSIGGAEIFSDGKYLGVATNNFAEYQAVLLALNWLLENKEKYRGHDIEFVLDSELVVRQLSGIYKIKSDSLRKLFLEAKEIENSLGMKVKYVNVRREKNKTADALVNTTLDKSI